MSRPTLRPCLLSGAVLVAALLETSTSSAQARVQYFGAPVVSNAQVVAVFWGPTVDSEIQLRIGDFYRQILNSGYIDVLSEYDTSGISAVNDGSPGTRQHIGRGIFRGSVAIDPQNKSTTLGDADIAQELETQISNG